MPTRAFVLEGPPKKFWDVSWDGGDVEITSGAWGTDGRAKSSSFDSPKERDAFIAAEIAKVVKKGYRETKDIAPASDAASAGSVLEANRLAARILGTTRRAWFPIFTTGDDGPHRVRGGMMLDPGEPWPVCPVCGEALTGLLELDRSALPDGAPKGDDLAQLFWCEAWERRPGAQPCPADDGWLARLRPRTGERRTGPGYEPVSITGWKGFDELAPRADEGLRQALDDADPEVIDALLRTRGAARNADDPYRAVAQASGKAARSIHKLGGWAVTVQESEDVDAGLALFQIEMQPPFNANFGDVGAAHLYLGPRGRLGFYWSCH